MIAPPARAEDTVYLFAAKPRDVRLGCDFLRRAGFRVRAFATMEALLGALEPASAGALVLTEEGVRDEEFDVLRRLLATQPKWSDLPVILFVPPRHVTSLHGLGDRGGNVTTLERPVMSGTLAAALRSALRSRHKQYELRDLLDGLQRATARLQEQDRRKDEFLAMLGHELRNPLAAIHNALHVIRRASGAEALDRAHGVIERQAGHLARLVDDLLDVSRVTLGRIQLVRSPVDVQELAARCVQNFLPAARADGRTLRYEPGDGPLVVHGDVVRLEQVLANLVANALKYTPSGGAIHVRTGRQGDEAIVRIADTGMGIDADVLPHVFELFAQGAQPLDRKRGGLGLGLLLVQSLVQRHGGAVEARSDGPGCGSEFTVRLPLAAGAVEEPAQPLLEGPGRLECRVLVVEDNDDARETLRMMLELWGCSVATSADGVEGLERLLTAPPDFAIIDIGLPRLDGYEVARRARAAGGDEVVLIAMTGYGQPEDNRRAIEAGFDVHLTKPIRDHELWATLRRDPLCRPRADAEPAR